MKFKWKVFFSTIAVIAIAFAVGGYILVNATFQSSLEREVGQALDENLLIKLAYEAASANYTTLTDQSIEDIVSQIEQTGNRNIYVLDEDQTPLYPLDSTVSASDLIAGMESNRAYRISKEGDQYHVWVCSRVTAGGRTVYILSVRQITNVFTQRDAQYQVYRVLTIAILTASAVIMFFISSLLTRPLKRLSRVTRRIASGNYQERAVVSTDDELGEFTRNFNSMADVLEEKIQDLEEVARQREEFMANFAHELKTPLTSIIGYADMLRSQEMDPSTAFKAANYIFAEGKRVESLSLKLMELIVLGKSEFALHPVNIHMVFEEIHGVMAPSLNKLGLELKLQYQDANILAEPDLLKTMLLNFIDNARKASSPGTTIELTGSILKGCYKIAVTDHGTGIPQEELSRITDAFYMVDKSRARAQHGAGLGLALCDKIAKLHQTELHFESELGVGTSVWVTFALAPPISKGSEERIK